MARRQEKLGLASLRQRTWYIQGTCATSGPPALHFELYIARYITRYATLQATLQATLAHVLKPPLPMGLRHTCPRV